MANDYHSHGFCTCRGDQDRAELADPLRQAMYDRHRYSKNKILPYQNKPELSDSVVGRESAPEPILNETAF